MKLRSSIAAKYAGVAMVMCLMPVVPVVADAQTTYEQQQSTEQNNTSNIQVSYVEKVSDIVAAGYETVYETNFAGAQDYAAEAVALTDSYIEVKAGADEDAETVGRLYDYSLVYVDELFRSYRMDKDYFWKCYRLCKKCAVMFRTGSPGSNAGE